MQTKILFSLVNLGSARIKEIQNLNLECLRIPQLNSQSVIDTNSLSHLLTSIFSY